MDEWKRFNETLPEKEFYSNLNMDNITDYMLAKRICKDFKVKKLGEYHDLYLIHYIWLMFSKTSEKCV